jgi:hypothetical protein
VAERNPRWEVFGDVGDQGEEKKYTGAKEKKGEHFVPRSIFDTSSHCRSH